LESIIRLQSGVCGNATSIEEESFSVGTDFENLMEYPQYTRPAIWNNIEVPQVLRSGNHQTIKTWRLQQAKNLTNFYQTNQSRIDNQKF
jgi:tRNA (guanine37-N1)-methyltransferase